MGVSGVMGVEEESYGSCDVKFVTDTFVLLKLSVPY